MPTFAKLNLKDQDEIVVLNAPASFEPELKTLKGVTVRRDAKGGDIDFSLAFVMTQKEVDTLGPQVAKKAKGDAVVWFAYPKGSSKKYKSEINRDERLGVMGKAGFEPVRMVAIDEDWSAVRFRRVEFIKTMNRPEEVRLTKKASSARPTARASAMRCRHEDRRGRRRDSRARYTAGRAVADAPDARHPSHG